MHHFSISKRILTYTVAACLALSFAACGSAKKTADTSGQGATPSSAQSSESAAAKGETRIIKDIDGKDVKLPKQVNRIADLWHANNQVVLLLGGADKLVATTQAIQGIPWYHVVYPRIKDVPAPVTVGNDVNMEGLLSTNPDVVISANDAQVQACRDAKIPTVKVMFQNFADLKRTVTITAETIGTDEAMKKAQEYNAYLDKNLKYAEDRVKDLQASDKPRVLHIAGGDNLIKVDGSKSLIGEWMKVSGAVNSIPDVANLKDITLEKIIQSNPDIIIVGGTMSQKGIDQIMSDPAWADVKAVRDKKVLRNPVGTYNWDRYSSEEALQILWAAKTFHPDKFQDLDLAAETQKFYKQFYNFDLSKDQAERIIEGEAPAK